MREVVNIRNVRVERGLSQEDLAYLLGVSQGLVSAIELGERNMTREVAETAEKLLNVPLLELLKRVRE